MIRILLLSLFLTGCTSYYEVQKVQTKECATYKYDPVIYVCEESKGASTHRLKICEGENAREECNQFCADQRKKD